MNGDMKLARGILLGVLIALTFGWTYTYDTDTPDGSIDAPSVIDDRIREVKDAIQERMNVNHYWPLTGTEVSDTAVGQQRKIHFYGPIDTPTNAANKMFLYGKDVDGKIEFHVLDEDGNELQFTDAGAFNMALLTSKTITTPTLTSPVLNTGVSGSAVLDEDDMASDSATQISTQKSIKAYTNDQIAAVFTDYSGGQSHTLPGGLIIKTGIALLSVSIMNHTTTITYETPFPNANIGLSVTGFYADEVFHAMITGARTAAAFNCYKSNTGNDYVFWTAIGY